MTDAYTVSISEQILEVQLCARGHADIIERSTAGKLKFPEETVERRRGRLAACEAAIATLRLVKAKIDARQAAAAAESPSVQAGAKPRDEAKEQQGLF